MCNCKMKRLWRCAVPDQSKKCCLTQYHAKLRHYRTVSVFDISNQGG
jgi:hypothetical protein